MLEHKYIIIIDKKISDRFKMIIWNLKLTYLNNL
jgi:hypothetical protein